MALVVEKIYANGLTPESVQPYRSEFTKFNIRVEEDLDDQNVIFEKTDLARDYCTCVSHPFSIMAKRKRETKEQGLSAQEKPLDSKKQKKSHEETVEPQGLGDALAETLPAETVSPKSKTTDGATKLARQIAKRERRKLQRMQNQESRGGSKGGKAGLKQEDSIQKLSEKELLSKWKPLEKIRILTIL